MAVLNPIKVTIRGKSTESVHEVPDFPFEKAGAGSHTVVFGNTFFIDNNDFRLEDSADYFGLAPGKIVGLKYCNAKIKCIDVIKNANGDPIEIICDDVTAAEESKAKVTIQWVPEKNATPVEIRLYSHLFLTEEVADAEWESLLNPKSEVVVRGLVDGSIVSHYKAASGMHFQFERIGFFICDKDSTADNLVFNLTVALKDSKPHNEATAVGPSKSRKEEQDRVMAEKLARQSIKAEDFFRTQTDLYSQFDAEGVPTHDNEGKELSKSAYKKLKKDWEKQDRLYKDWEKNQKK
jgi:glutaminyl-tRNA synthetase